MEQDLLALPSELDSELKNIIERSFLHTISEIGEHEIAYIRNKFDYKIASAHRNTEPWINKMIQYYQILFDELFRKKIEIEKGDKYYNIIGAALFYFINPYDVIPDFTKEIGYLDDFYIVTLCLKHLDEEHQSYLIEKFNDIDL